MNQNIRNYVNGLNRRTFTNNTQRALYTLLTTTNENGWMARSRVRIPSQTSRIRDLRTANFGEINVECVPASTLGRNCSKYTFFYRVNPQTLTLTQVRRVFEGR